MKVFQDWIRQENHYFKQIQNSSSSVIVCLRELEGEIKSTILFRKTNNYGTSDLSRNYGSLSDAMSAADDFINNYIQGTDFN